MRHALPLALAVTAALILACGGGSGKSSSSGGMKAGKDGYRAHFDASCASMDKEFRADVKKAKKKYNYKTIFLTGKVKTPMKSGRLELAASGSAVCTVKPYKGSAAKEAGKLKAGKTAAFHCKSDGYAVGPKFKDCSVVR